MKTIATIQGCAIFAHVHKTGNIHCSMLADGDIDCDGSGGNPDHDPYFQPDTSLHHDGKPLNAYKVPFIVLPPAALSGVGPQVLGCSCKVYDRETDLWVDGVVGDIGPRFKVGEISVEMARRLGMPNNPNTGGTSDFNRLLYVWYPGVPAVVDGITYKLQNYRGA